MAEPRAITPPRGAAPEWDVLVATKFHVPRAGFVPRPRLLARLAQGVDRGLTVVCTPAGFGKTTLLGDWARRSRRPAAWLSLDAGDNDPARFWRYVATALDRARPGTCAPLAALLRGPQQPPPEAVDSADQPADEPARRGRGRAPLGRLSPDRGAAGARQRDVLAGPAAAGAAAGARQPPRSAAAAGAAAGPRPARRAAGGR